jgi:hypothetical protein
VSTSEEAKPKQENSMSAMINKTSISHQGRRCCRRSSRNSARRTAGDRAGADPLAHADLCRRCAGRARHQALPSTAFNKIANGEMEIELFFADQIVPTGELFRAMQKGTIDAVHSDDDSMAVAHRGDRVRRLLPVRHALRSLDVPVLFNQYGLKEIWRKPIQHAGWREAFRPAPGPVQLQHQEGSLASPISTG